MAVNVVKLANVYEPLTFNAGVQEAAIEYNRFLSSGVLVRDQRIDDMVAVGGMVGELPFFHDLDRIEPNYTTDDNTDVTINVGNVDSGTQIFRLANQHRAWSTMDLARQLALQDPMGAITSRIGQYWAVNSQERLISSAVGVFADNLANDAGDMINAIHNEEGTAATAANLISAEAIIDAELTMGDHASAITAIAMHSIVFAGLKKQNLIDYIPNARGEVNIPTYLGLTVIEDDALPTRNGTTDGTVYTSILFGSGAFSYGEAAPLVPSEPERVQAAGNGGGQDLIHVRRSEIIHPNGFAFQSANQAAGVTATRAHLQLAAEWDRIYTNRKNIPMAFVTSNG